MTDLRQSSQYVDYLEKTGWQVEKIDGAFVFIRKLPLTPFSIIKIQRPEKLPDLRKIERLARQHRAVSVFVEPLNTDNNQQLTINNFKLSKSPFLPTKTIQLDLGQSEKKLLAQMKKDSRYCLRKFWSDESIHQTEMKGEEEIRNFYRVWKKAAGWRQLIPGAKSILALKEAFGKKALLLAAQDGEQILAGAVILIAGPVAYYYYAFTVRKGPKFLA
jgi:hypothetical protein